MYADSFSRQRLYRRLSILDLDGGQQPMGLVFLGFVLLLLLAGLAFHDRNPMAAPLAHAPPSPPQGARGSVVGVGIVTLLSLLVASLPGVPHM